MPEYLKSGEVGLSFSEFELVADYLPIPLDSIRVGGLVGFDIYIRAHKKFMLYRKGSLPFTMDVQDRLYNLNAKTLYIKALQIDNYLEHLEGHLDEVLSRQDVPVEEKAESLYSALANSMRAFLASPKEAKHLAAVKRLARGLVSLLLRENSALGCLLREMPPDFANRTHAANVAIYAVTLANMVAEPDKEYLYELALGALLHDLGKTKVALETFSNGEELAESELLRNHPVWGVKLLEEVEEIPAVSSLAILSHQERYDGSGYPFALKGAKTSLVGRTMAIADVFDALTTRMPYREAMTACDALRLMQGEMAGQFDDAIMERFIMLLAGRERLPYPIGKASNSGQGADAGDVRGSGRGSLVESTPAALPDLSASSESTGGPETAKAMAGTPQDTDGVHADLIDVETSKAPVEMAELAPGDHVCWLYETDEEFKTGLVTFIESGLERGEKVECFVDSASPEVIAGYLKEQGLDPGAYTSGGQLQIAATDEVLKPLGEFSSEKLTAFLSAEAEKAVSQGFCALRVAGEMGRALSDPRLAERLIEYEAMTNELSQNANCLLLGIYDRRQFCAQMLLDVLATHPLVIVETELYENPYYVPPDEFLRVGRAAATLNHKLESIASSKSMRQEQERLIQHLEEQQSRFKAVLEQMPAGVIVADAPGGRIVFTNEQFSDMLRCHNPAHPKTLTDLQLQSFHIDGRPYEPSELPLHRSVFAGEVVRSEEIDFVRGDGTRGTMSVSSTPIIGRGNQVLGGAAVLSDITERRRTTAALQRYKPFFDHARDIILLIGNDGRILEANPAAVKVYGYDREELLSMSVHDLRMAEATGCAAAEMSRAEATGVLFETLHRRKDGSTFPVEINSRGTIIDNKRVLLCIVRDVTERGRLMSGLRDALAKGERSQAQLEAAFHAIREGVAVSDMDGKFILVNEAEAKINGFRSVEDMKRDLAYFAEVYELSYPDGQLVPVDQWPISRVLRGESITDWELRGRRRDTGQEWFFSYSGEPVRDDAGRQILAVVVTRDITEQKRAEQERETIAEFLRLVNASLGTRDLIRAAATFLQRRSGLEAVGIRLQEGDDYPYFEARGFPDEFVVAENKLCGRDKDGRAVLDETGNPVLACMCGNVIRGRFDPSKPFFSARGSFWTNSTTELLATTTHADRQARTRNRCNAEGYESVALIALRAGEERLGLLQLNDRRKGVFTPEAVALWERLAGYLAVAVSKFRAEEALRQSESRYRGLWGAVEAGIVVQSAKGPVVDANERAQEIWGLSLEQMRALAPRDPAWMAIHEDGSPFPGEEYPSNVALVTGKKVENVVMGVNRPAGDRRWIIANAAPISGPGEERPLYSVATFIDITRQKNAEESLREANAKNSALIEASPLTIISLDPEGRVMSWSKGAERMFGWRAEEVLGQFNPIVPDEAMSRYQNIVRTAMLVQSVMSVEARVQSKDGLLLDVSASYAPLRDGNGNVVGSIGVIADITDRKAMEEAINAEKTRFEALFRNSTDAIVLLNASGDIVDVNDGFEQLFGYAADEARGRKLDHMLSPKDKHQEARSISRRTLKGEVVAVETERQRKDGSIVPVLLRSIPIMFDGAVSGYYTTYADISELKHVETRLRLLGMTDTLTGLHNRAFFEEEMRRLDWERNSTAGLIVCDVNGLKLVNDTLGHEYGDRLLRRAGEVLRASARPMDVVARIGGDDFAVILSDCTGQVLTEVCDSILANCRRDNEPSAGLPLNMSWGSALRESPEMTMRDLFRLADDAMYRDKLTRIDSSRSSIVESLKAALFERDNLTEEHAERLRQIAKALGKAAGLQDPALADLRALAVMHDIGKISVPDSILLKPGPLTAEERQIMQRHPEIGYRIASASPELAPVAEYILHHHENWDGTGYPGGLAGERIPIVCRILSIVDAYDAMTSDRPYRMAKKHHEAIAELCRQSGTQFDPRLIELFAELAGKEACLGGQAADRQFDKQVRVV